MRRAAWRLWTVAGILAFPVGAQTGDAASGGADIELSLPEAVERALRDNPILIDARLRRGVERFDLRQAERRFVPEVSFGTLGVEQTGDLGGDADFYRLAAGPGMLLRLPTGGDVEVSPGWSVFLDGSGQAVTDGAGVRLRLRQPLLRGGGVKVGTAPVRLARIAEASYVLAFEAATMDVVTAVIYGYRAVIGAERRMAIDRGALDRTRAMLAVNRALIDTGRMAASAIAETEAEVARGGLALTRSRDPRDNATRDLNVMLNLDGGSRVIPTESATLDPGGPPPSLEAALARARIGHSGYRRALLDVESAAIGVTLAENDMLWDLSLTADAEWRREGTTGAAGESLARELTRPPAVGLAPSIPANDPSATARLPHPFAARTAARQAPQAPPSTVRRMETDVRNGVRAAGIGLREVELAGRALELAESKLEVEEQKLRLGRTTNFRVTQFQADLVQAQVNELSSRIGYLNALAALDRTVGGTLDTWNIDVEAMQE